MNQKAIYRPSVENVALRQGEILTNVSQYNPVLQEQLQDGDELSFNRVIHPYAIVITQDCDLDWDYRARQSQDYSSSKLLNSAILCEIGTARDVRDINDKSVMNSTQWKLIKSQRHERFYFFETIPRECDLDAEGLPELTADFKRVFGIDSESLYNQINSKQAKRRTILCSPYLEHFSQRYSSFHNRVALPAQYESEP